MPGCKSAKSKRLIIKNETYIFQPFHKLTAFSASTTVFNYFYKANQTHNYSQSVRLTFPKIKPGHHTVGKCLIGVKHPSGPLLWQLSYKG